MARPEEDFLDALPVDEEITLPEDRQHSVATTRKCAGLFRPTVIWRFDTRSFVIPVTETVRFGWRWVVGVLFGVTLVVIGELLGWLSVIDPTSSVACSVLGGGILTAMYAVAARYTCLDRSVLAVSSRERRLSGSAVLGGCCLFLTLGMTNSISALAGVVLYCLVLASITQRRSRVPFMRRTEWKPTVSIDVPRVPARHCVYSTLSAGVLATYISLVTELAVPHPRAVVAIGGLVLPIVGGLLWYIPTRERARVHAFGAAVLSGSYVLFVVVEFALGSRVTGPSLDQTASVPLIGIAAGLALLWVSLWWIGIVNPRRIRREFSADGRRVNTHVAAVFAYLSIMGSGLLGLGVLVSIPVLWVLATTGISRWFALVTAAFALPALYFVTGSLYQLTNAFRLSIRFRRDATPIPPDQLPIDTAYPVKRLPSESLHNRRGGENETETESAADEAENTGEFFAAAYADPFGREILVTEYTYHQLSDEELAAIIVHEESHFEHRGAQLQFLFATLPACAFMGKNVVYSIYDFFRRELTADQYAYVRLATRGELSPAEPLKNAIERFKSEAVPFVDETSIGFLPTMLSVPEREVVSSRIGRWFELFFGNFAGDVHPDTDTRRRALSLSAELPLDEEEKPADRAGLILRDLEEERHDRRFE